MVDQMSQRKLETKSYNKKIIIIETYGERLNDKQMLRFKKKRKKKERLECKFALEIVSDFGCKRETPTANA